MEQHDRAQGRRGGRDRDQIIGHVIDADTAYARKLGIKLKQSTIGDTGAIGELREAIAAVLGAPSDGSPVTPSGWTTRYAARRIAWHVLEHAREMQDRADRLDLRIGLPWRISTVPAGTMAGCEGARQALERGRGKHLPAAVPQASR